MQGVPSFATMVMRYISGRTKARRRQGTTRSLPYAPVGVAHSPLTGAARTQLVREELVSRFSQ